MADSSTTLNPGVGGDKMDESQILQSDLVTLAKRPRIVLGGDRGADSAGVNDTVQPVAVDPGKNPYSAPTLPQAIVNDAAESGYVSGELRALSMTTDGRLRVSAAAPRYEVLFFAEPEGRLWGSLEPNINQVSSPWASW